MYVCMYVVNIDAHIGIFIGKYANFIGEKTKNIVIAVEIAFFHH